jgi:hypothetical protein
MKTQLLCSFCKKNDVQETVDLILQTYAVVFDKIFVLKNVDNQKELMVTYNIDVADGQPQTMLENTISLHRKKETNTLYTINALNYVIALLNDGVVNKSFPMPWENYKNCLLLANENGLKQINTEIAEVIKIVRE